MPITKRRLPEILIAMIFFIVAVWNFFTANVMEQFLRFHSFASILGGISRWIGMCGFVILPVALIYREERCRILAITAVLPAIAAPKLLTGISSMDLACTVETAPVISPFRWTP